ncbi:MAG: PKD domain-containing protein, partial [Bacteroidales bacterium]|nr:PKD domain-containing protein [Bacteroidales bacterium]
MLHNIFSQEYNRANIWYFGNEAGIDFNSGEPVPIYDNKLIAGAWRGTTVMSDTNGSMLFYTHGLRICNQIHGFMDPTFMEGSLDVITFPAPGSNNLYYVFSVPNYLPTASYTLNFYSIVDMTLNGGLGDVSEPIQIPGAYGADQKLTAIKHKNKKDVWVVFRLLQHEKYASYLITEDGLIPQAVLSPAPYYEDFTSLQLAGQIRISYDKKYLILANVGGVYNNEERDIIEICKFDAESGEVNYLYSMQIRDDSLSSSLFHPGGIEFSPDSKFAYFSVFIAGADSGLIYQYDMQFVEDSASFNQSKELIGIGTRLMGLQLARDGKIYCTGYYGGGGGRPYISLIHKPWEKGISCDFQKEALYLTPGGGEGQLTNILLDYLYRFDYKGVCEGDTFQFDPWFIPDPTYIEWNFGDPMSGANNTSTIPHATHKFTDGGTYEVSVHVEYPSGRIEETSREVEVEYDPEPDLGPDTTICNGDNIILNAECGPHFYLWSTGAFGGSQITVSDTGWYWVKVTSNAGCFEIDSIHLSFHPPAIVDTINLEIIPTTCGGSTGVIRGILISGLPPLSYQWLDDLGNPISNSLDIYHLPVGNYTLEVTDSNNCISSFGPFSIIDAGDVLIENVDYTQEHCDQQDASITITAVSGLGDMLFYSIDNGANYFSNQGIFTALSAGSYAVRVRDSSDCQSVYINNPVIIQNIDAP